MWNIQRGVSFVLTHALKTHACIHTHISSHKSHKHTCALLRPFFFSCFFYSRPEQEKNRDVNNRDTDDSGGRRATASCIVSLIWAIHFTCSNLPRRQKKNVKGKSRIKQKRIFICHRITRGIFLTTQAAMVLWTYYKDDTTERTECLDQGHNGPTIRLAFSKTIVLLSTFYHG